MAMLPPSAEPWIPLSKFAQPNSWRAASLDAHQPARRPRRRRARSAGANTPGSDRSVRALLRRCTMTFFLHKSLTFVHDLGAAHDGMWHQQGGVFLTLDRGWHDDIPAWLPTCTTYAAALA